MFCLSLTTHFYYKLFLFCEENIVSLVFISIVVVLDMYLHEMLKQVIIWKKNFKVSKKKFT